MRAYAKTTLFSVIALSLSLLLSFQAHAGKTQLQGNLIVNPDCAADVT